MVQIKGVGQIESSDPDVSCVYTIFATAGRAEARTLTAAAPAAIA
jgi:hypothetical protein